MLGLTTCSVRGQGGDKRRAFFRVAFHALASTARSPVRETPCELLDHVRCCPDSRHVCLFQALQALPQPPLIPATQLPFPLTSCYAPSSPTLMMT